VTVRLDLGAGAISPPGYVPLGHAHGTEIYPLPYERESVDEIRASHCLEHFPFAQVPSVLKDWAEKLKPGGVLKIAVPNFEWIARAYLDGVQAPIEGYTLGGQTDADDFHKSLYDPRTLADLFREAGLTDFGFWESDAEDCSRLPVSLNMRAVKPVPMMPGSFNVSALMSMPRLGFTDNFMCAQTALNKQGIEVRPFVGAFWGQCLERGFEMLAAENIDAALVIDYDTVFTAQNVNTLIRLMLLHPEVDAAGQDGSYLAELLLDKGYEVHGLVRRVSQPNFSNLTSVLDRLSLHTGDMTDGTSLFRVIETVRPDEIYNFAAMSQVRDSYDHPEVTQDINANGLLRILEACRTLKLDAKIYQACSSEMFGKVRETPQTEPRRFIRARLTGCRRSRPTISPRYGARDMALRSIAAFCSTTKARAGARRS
jgi:hypothetical protein